MKSSKRKFNLKSKKGMTLIELVIAITIIVIIFAGTLGALVNGYTTTIYNANHDQMAAKSAAVNEIIMQAVKRYEWPEGTNSTSVDPDHLNAIDEAAKAECSSIIYVDPADFPKDNVDYQYTIIYDAPVSTAKTASSSVNIPGVTIRTAINSASGLFINESFVPYKS